VGTRQNQHLVSISPQDKGKGTDFALVYVQTHGRRQGHDLIHAGTDSPAGKWAPPVLASFLHPAVPLNSRGASLSQVW